MDDVQMHVNGRRDRDRVIVEVTGEVDYQTADDLEDEIVELLGPDGSELLIDLEDASEFDSSGMRVLVRLDQLVRARGGSLTIHRPSGMVRRLMEITGLTSIEMDDDPPPS